MLAGSLIFRSEHWLAVTTAGWLMRTQMLILGTLNFRSYGFFLLECSASWKSTIPIFYWRMCSIDGTGFAVSILEAEYGNRVEILWFTLYISLISFGHQISVCVSKSNTSLIQFLQRTNSFFSTKMNRH